VGIRDHAIITLLARLGLRSIEIARMQLEDLDWRAGELAVRGKARRPDRMPLPDDIGKALVACLSVRPSGTDARHVFMTCKAPRRQIRADLVGDVVERACRRACLPETGPHRQRSRSVRRPRSDSIRGPGRCPEAPAHLDQGRGTRSRRCAGRGD
jgi:integrase